MICGLGVDRGLGVVTLQETIWALHDPAFRIGEVALRLGRRLRLRLGLHLRRGLGSGLGLRLRRPPSAFALVLQQRAGGRRLGLGSSLGLSLGFQRRLGLLDLGHAPDLVGHPVGRLIATRLAQGGVLRLVGLLGGRQPGLDLGLQLRLGLEHPLIAHRLVLGGVGFDLRPVQRHMAQIGQPSPLAQPQHLHEQSAQRRQVTSPELADRPVIGPVHRRHRQEVQPLLAGPRHPSR